VHDSMQDPGNPFPVDPGLWRQLAEVLVAIAPVLNAFAAGRQHCRLQQPSVPHRPWCLPQAHAVGDTRCVSAAMATSPYLACWLVDRQEGPCVVIDLAPGGVELSLDEARDNACHVLELVAMASGPPL
jgi:hypothetical protein